MGTQKLLVGFGLFLSVFAYSILSYTLVRSQTLELFSVYSGLFLLCYFLLRNLSGLRMLLLFGLLLRLVFLWSLPHLSQDFYRFLWDGNIQWMGINPYIHTPNRLIELIQFPQSQVLFEGMGSLSQGHFSNYPPLSQWIYKAATLVHFDNLLSSVNVLRVFILLGDLMVFIFGSRLLKILGKSSLYIGWYFLNPIVIIELFGNLHAEGIMLGLTLMGAYFIFKNKLVWGSAMLSLAIAAKLLPLLILPVFFKFLGWKKGLQMSAWILLFSGLLWFPFWEKQMLENYMVTLRLWFNRFEFNGSLYYMVRALGYEIKGYNIIRTLGKFTPFLTLGWVFVFSFLRKNRTANEVLKSSLWLLSIYFFSATTVHPWYVITLVGLGIMTGYLYPIIWSFTVFWSYSAYGAQAFEEQTLWLFLEYLPVYACFGYEVFKKPLLQHFQEAHFFDRQSAPRSSG